MPQRRNRIPKDLGAPKRPQSAYFIFSNQKRPKLKEEHPTLKITEISKLIATEWKQLSNEKKEPYEEQAKIAKVQYGIDSEAYKKTTEYAEYQKRLKAWREEQDETKPTKQAKSAKPLKKPKDKNAPKRPQSSYFLFQNMRRKQLREEKPDLKLADVSKTVALEWKAMSVEDKKPYEEKSQDQKHQYKIKLEEYKQTDEYKQYQQEVAKWKSAKNKKPVESASDDSDDDDDDNDNDDDDDSNEDTSDESDNDESD